MNILLAGLGAALLAYIVNLISVKIWSEAAVRWLVPVIEESVKTGLAVFFHAFIPVVHLLFGLIEAFYDMSRHNRAGRLGAVLSITGHALFGSLTYAGLFFLNSLYLGLFVGVIVHMAWNLFAMSSTNRRV